MTEVSLNDLRAAIKGAVSSLGYSEPDTETILEVQVQSS